jgi:hypothetical protein
MRPYVGGMELCRHVGFICRELITESSMPATLPKREAAETKQIGLQEFQSKTRAMEEQFIELQHDTDQLLERIHPLSNVCSCGCVHS